ncbi:MAG: tetratricopeptide repeat protein [Bacteroidia bacterium]|nr:tetratricopeptide repeat protein [Bacteroidia bacterium]
MYRFFLLLFVSVLSCGLSAQNNFSKYYSEAAENTDKGNYQLGIENFNKAIAFKEEAKNKYKIADAYIYRAYCRYQLKNYKAAIKDVNEAIAIKPEYTKGYQFKATFLLDMKNYDSCIAVCAKGLSYQSSNEELLFTKAKASFNKKEYSVCHGTLVQAIEINPNNTDAIRLLACVYQKRKQWDSSLVYFNKVLEIDPLDYVSLFDRGISKSHLKDFSGAQVDIEKAMQIDTASKFIGYNNLGFFLDLEKKDYEKALESFNKSIALAPGFAYAYSNRAFAKLQLGDIKGAYADIHKSLSLDPENTYAYKNLGLIQLRDKKTKAACKSFSKAIDMGYTEAYDNAVELLQKENCP